MAFSRIKKFNDVEPDLLSSSAFGPAIAHNLGIKGFCTVSSGLNVDTLNNALKDIKGLQAAGRFFQPASLLADGLLGREGSSFIANVDPKESDVGEDVGPCESLSFVEQTLAHVCLAVGPVLYDLLDVDISHFSGSVLHETGDCVESDEDETEVPLSEKQVEKWMPQIIRGKFMASLFLGPTPGTLALHPFDEEADVHQMKTVPGLIVVVRTDLVYQKFASSGRSFALSTFLMQRPCAVPWRSAFTLTPVTAKIHNWLMQRLETLKNQELAVEGTAVWPAHVPRVWQKVMNHQWAKLGWIALRSCATRYPATWSPTTWFLAQQVGTDFITGIPMDRWNHEQHYDPDVESWRMNKSYCRHGSFQEGVDMFDHKLFTLSAIESRSMDPNQRNVLEVGYEALYRAGLRKATLMNAECGVYVGHGTSEWQHISDITGDSGLTGCALSITSNRLSFCLGLRGSSMTVDTEAASGLTVLYMASESVQRKGMAAANSTSVAIGVHIMLAGRFFAHYCASGFLSKLGRCCSFNSTADGYVRADGTNAVVVELLADTHGATAREEVLGTLAGTVMKHNGTCPSLTAPCGPAEQEAIAEAVRNAGISALDVDVCEAHASGAVLADSVEVNSLMRCHRQEGSDENLDVVAGKSATGNMVYAASLASFLRTVDSMKHGTALPTLHLAQMNPHIVHRNQLSLPDDVTLFRWGTSFGGVMARGFGGTDVYAVAHGRVADDRVAPVLEHRPLQLTFWPGGGGESEWPQPKRGYFIIGTWCRWKHPVRMHDDGSGVFGYTLTLGENGWEKFQIWIDGNPNLILYPDDRSEYKDSVVLGPDSHAKAGWIVDGRHERVFRNEHVTGNGGVGSLEDHDTCSVGDRFRVQLHVSGKWRMVSWRKICDDDTRVARPLCGMASYFLVCSWNDWKFQEMTRTGHVPGRFELEVQLLHDGGEFQIVRDEDFDQTLYPMDPYGFGDTNSTILGPDGNGRGLNWWLGGRAGDVFRIFFERSEDSMQVGWELLRHLDLSAAQLASLARPRYSVVGSWDGWAEAWPMLCEDSECTFFLQLGASCEESFQILEKGRWETTLYPDREDAHPSSGYRLCGPGSAGHGLNWTVGRHLHDAGAPGKCYKIVLVLNTVDGIPRVEWDTLDSTVDVHSVMNEGFFASGR